MPAEYNYNDSFSNRLAVFCSDERFIKPTLSFMQDSLDIASSDLMILPGGPEFIASGRTRTIKRMDLLVKAHEIEEIVLISHQDCGYYQKLFKNNTGELIYKRQIDDIRRSMRIVEKKHPGIRISGYYCRIKNNYSVFFDKIEY